MGIPVFPMGLPVSRVRSPIRPIGSIGVSIRFSNRRQDAPGIGERFTKQRGRPVTVVGRALRASRSTGWDGSLGELAPPVRKIKQKLLLLQSNECKSGLRNRVAAAH